MNKLTRFWACLALFAAPVLAAVPTSQVLQDTGVSGYGATAKSALVNLNGPTEGQGIDLVGRGVKRLASYTEAHSLTAATTVSALVITSTDGGVFRRDPTDTTSAEDGGGFCGTIIRGADYATNGVWKRVAVQNLDPRWYGAAGDGVTDDTAAVQRTITQAIATNRDVVMAVRCLLTAPVNIDRQVDGLAFDNYFRIYSTNGGGFVVTTNIAMFSSTIAFTTAPVSQLVQFDGITFIGTAAASYVLNDGRFLRIRFFDCNFDKILLVNSSIYTQSVQVSRSNIRRANGNFFTSTNFSYDFKFVDNIVEAYTGNLLTLAQPVGSAVSHNLLEGISGTALIYNGSQGLAIHGNYFELNGKDIDGTGANVAYGVDLKGNFFSHSPSNQFSVIWGAGGQLGCESAGNFHNGSMHSIAIYPKPSQLRINDVALTQLTSVSAVLTPDDFFNQAVLQGLGHYLQIPTVAGWTAAVTGSGSTIQASSYNQVRTGTTVSSTARLYTDFIGGFANTTLFGINFGKPLVFRFNLARSTTEPNAIGRVQLKTVQTEGDLAATGIGIKVLNYALYGESYGTAQAMVNLNTTLSDSNNYQIEIRHYPGLRDEWWVNGVLAGSQTTVANIPNAIATTYLVHSLITQTSNPSGDAQQFLLQPSLWVGL